MRSKYLKILSANIILSIISVSFSQIPNSSFENWYCADIVNPPDPMRGWCGPWYWRTFNSEYVTTFYPATDTGGNYPGNFGWRSLRLENNISILPSLSSYGYASTGRDLPAFPIQGHPNRFCGYFKYFPKNNDTMYINLNLFYGGNQVATATLSRTDTVSNWTPFDIPISNYLNVDSGNIILASYYANTLGKIPNGNSVLYVDNLSFDSLITTNIKKYYEKNKSTKNKYYEINGRKPFNQNLELNKIRNILIK